LRSKTKVLTDRSLLEKQSLKAVDFDPWNFDGSSTRQAAGHDSEVFIKPV